MPSEGDPVHLEHFEAIRKVLDAIARVSKLSSAAKLTLAAMKADDLLQVAKGVAEIVAARKALANCIALLDESNFEQRAEAIRDLAGDLRLSYPTILREALQSEGHSVDGEWPSWVVDHAFRLRIDLQKVVGTLNADRLSDLSVSTILGKVRQFDEALKSVEVRQKNFEGIILAYEDAVKVMGLARGDYVDIRSIFDRRVGALRGGSQSQSDFGIELFAAMSHYDAQGRRIEFSPAQNASGGYFVPDRSGGNFVAALRLIDRDGKGK